MNGQAEVIISRIKFLVQATAQEQLTTKAQLPTNTQTTHATMSTRTNLVV